MIIRTFFSQIILTVSFIYLWNLIVIFFSFYISRVANGFEIFEFGFQLG